ncbi:Longin-like domain-containing protein [Radiomyces spectabilis]|uniref:Longin-like domain-containing protein n=1 Tax=Radiomyces spectabilis TaxID=64574 RepID=UPI00221F9E26|nr:Longin-like domain-containing protein [Radiomyces spectabilis]KAI8381596.1 Longin-like domain-containing protein [Radiomyces spectabilis]
MVKTTMIGRVSDGLPLAASMDDQQVETELADYKGQAKTVFKRLNANSEPRCSIESGNYVLHYIIEGSVCYLCICDKSYPRKLAFSYLEELAKEFNMSYGNEVEKPGLRPYAFVKFDTFMQKTKRIYQDTRTQSNLTKLNEDLQDVTRIMTKNMEDLLWRGDSLDRMSHISGELKDSAKMFKDKARHLNLQALYRKYGPPVIIASVILFVLLIRYYWF